MGEANRRREAFMAQSPHQRIKHLLGIVLKGVDKVFNPGTDNGERQIGVAVIVFPLASDQDMMFASPDIDVREIAQRLMNLSFESEPEIVRPAQAED